jgi:hypothetical protein
MLTVHNYPLVYEINTRCWLNDLSSGGASSVERITLATIPDNQFTYWTRLGFTHIWLMGAWQCGPLLDATEPDAAPSPYAITDYTVPDALGGDAGLARFRERLHDHGLKLMLDFVPNHTSCIHPWVRSHPERYVSSSKPAPESFRAGKHWIAHGKDPYFPAWTDTAQLDYRNPDTHSAMIDELLKVAERCDGVRCDMSILILNIVFAQTWRDELYESHFKSHFLPPQNEFWSDAIAAIRQKYPDFLCLAEAYWDREQDLLDLGFDYAYDKRIYDHLIARNPRALLEHLRSKGTEFLSRTAHFLENHDEPRVASLLNLEEHRAASLLTLALPGMRLLHEGQLTGAKIRARVHRSRRTPEPVQPAIADCYEQLLLALKDSGVGRGNFDLVPETPENVLALRWQSDPSRFDVAVINLGTAPQRFTMPLSSGQWLFPLPRAAETQSLASHRAALGRGEGEFAYVLAPHAAHFLHFRQQ